MLSDVKRDIAEGNLTQNFIWTIKTPYFSIWTIQMPPFRFSDLSNYI